MNYNTQQKQALEMMASFISPDNRDNFFILRGSAGTGKSTILKAVIKQFCESFDAVNVCAPTNKAAKVLKGKTGIMANTIHKLLYKCEEIEGSEIMELVKKENKNKNRCLFIVDESSMVGDRITENSSLLLLKTPLLTDFIEFVFQGNQENKIIFVGDLCQLPPVGYDFWELSPALDCDYLRGHKNLKGSFFDLTEVVRQSADSPILKNASLLRDHILLGKALPELHYKQYNGATEGLRQYLQRYDEEEDSKITMLTFTNKDANFWNKMIREQLGLAVLPLMPGDKIITDKVWMGRDVVIPKGEPGKVANIYSDVETFASLKFITADIDFSLEGQNSIISMKVCLNHLLSEKGGLSREEEMFLRHEAYKCNERFRKTGNPAHDGFLSAARLRYGYATTCHKAQGSEFEEVLMHPYYPRENAKWLYTAMTRAKKDFFSYRSYNH
jgi:exodeoxyribonuclease V